MALTTMTITLDKTSEEVQAEIDASDGMMKLELTWQEARAFDQNITGAVIEVKDPNDHSCWIARLSDIEWEGDGYPMTVWFDVV